MRIPAAVGTTIAFVCCAGACAARHPAMLPPAIPAVPGKPVDRFALRSIDVLAGTGEVYQPRKCLYVHYTGWLTNGTKFDSSRDPDQNGAPGEPIAFPQGVRRVIVGWDLGFDGMRVGGKRRLFIPYQLAYGEAERAPIPARSNLIFDVELMALADTLSHSGPAGGPPCPSWASVRGQIG